MYSCLSVSFYLRKEQKHNLFYTLGFYPIAVSGGYYHTIALNNNRSVWSWGSNCDGQLGDGTSWYCAPQTVSILDSEDPQPLGQSVSLTSNNYSNTNWLGGTSTINNIDITSVDANDITANNPNLLTPSELDDSYIQISETYELDTVTGIVLDKHILDLAEGGSPEEIMAEILPASALNKGVIWETSDENVAIVVNGKVIPVGEGVAIITATTTEGALFDTCQVFVQKANQTINNFAN